MSSQYGTISVTGEHDYYQNISLVAGRTYYIELVGYDGSPLPDTYLNLFRGTQFGTLVASDDDGGGWDYNSRIVFTATQTGNYTVDVGAYADAYTGDYHLLINEDDYRGTVDGDGLTFRIGGNGAVGPLNTGGSHSGTINYSGDGTTPGDADLFQVNLIAGLNYALEMRGSPTGNGSLDDSYLYLLDSGGNLITSDDDGGVGYNSYIGYQAQYSGTHYLEAHSYASSDTGTYRVYASVGVGSALGDYIVGLDSADAVDGSGGNDTIFGGNGNDNLAGNVGNDWLFGEAGNDRLRGQAGADVLNGGAGRDVLIGGTGNDRFDFDFASDSAPGNRDTIRAGDGAIAFQGVGFAPGDRIDLRDIDANSATFIDNAFHFGGGFVGRLTLSNAGANTLVQGNTDGDAAMEFSLVIEDGAGIGAGAYQMNDFYL